MKKLVLFPTLLLTALSVILLSSFYLKQAKTSINEEGGADFSAFLKLFPKGQLPYTITQEDLKKELSKLTKGESKSYDKKTVKIDYRQHKFLPLIAESRFSRIPISAEPIISFETEKHIAVIYNIGRGYSNKNYAITVFNKKGEHISSYYMASARTSSMQTASIKPDLTMTVNKYDIKWQNEVAEKGLKGNTITNLVLTQTDTVDLTQKSNVHEIEKTTPSVKTLQKEEKAVWEM
jgi:hypothetical protein